MIRVSSTQSRTVPHATSMSLVFADPSEPDAPMEPSITQMRCCSCKETKPCCACAPHECRHHAKSAFPASCARWRRGACKQCRVSKARSAPLLKRKLESARHRYGSVKAVSLAHVEHLLHSCCGTDKMSDAYVDLAAKAQLISNFSRHSLRSQIAYVGQETFLFKGSVRENIACGRPGASDEQIVAAARAAHAHEFIVGFERGYDSPVGEQGMQLSGGQRQRISIARAFLKNAPLILLDEATSALDTESERAVQEALKTLCAGRTTLVIAHRLSTVASSERICVIEGGQVVESGRQDELLARNGVYSLLHRTQFERTLTLAPSDAAAE